MRLPDVSKSGCVHVLAQTYLAPFRDDAFGHRGANARGAARDHGAAVLEPALIDRVHRASPASARHSVATWRCSPSNSNSQRHHVARLEEQRGRLSLSDAGRGSRRQDVAGFERDELADIGNEMCNAEDHGARVAALHATAIEVEPEVKALRIRDLVSGHQKRADRTESVATLALVPLRAAFLLEGSLGNIVHQQHSLRRGITRWLRRHSERGLPMTMPSSTSQSVFCEPRGIMTGSFGPLRQEIAFVKMIGSEGAGRPASAA